MKILSVIILLLTGFSLQNAQAQQRVSFDPGFLIEADIGVNVVVAPTKMNTLNVRRNSEDFSFSDATAGSPGVTGMIRLSPINTPIFAYTVEGERSFGMLLQYEHNFKRITHELRLSLPFGTLTGRYQQRDLTVTHYRREYVIITRLDETLYHSPYRDIERLSLRFTPGQNGRLTLGLFSESAGTDDLPYPDEDWIGVFIGYKVAPNWSLEAELIPTHPSFGVQQGELTESVDLREEGIAFTVSLRRNMRFSGSYRDLFTR